MRCNYLVRGCMKAVQFVMLLISYNARKLQSDRNKANCTVLLAIGILNITSYALSQDCKKRQSASCPPVRL